MKIEPCPYCGGECQSESAKYEGKANFVSCIDMGCNYFSGNKPTESEAIEAHNRLSRLAGARVEETKRCGDCAAACRVSKSKWKCALNPTLRDSEAMGELDMYKLNKYCPLRKAPVVLMLGEEKP